MSQLGGEPVPETGIPTGLNRIKTRRVNLKDRSTNLDDIDGAQKPTFKHNQLNGTQRERNITSWLKARRSKDHSQDVNDYLPNSKHVNPEVKGFGKEVQRTTLHKVGKRSNVDLSSSGNSHTIKVPKGLKSFSHELGPKGGLRPIYTRAQSYNDLKELLESFHSRFDAAKEVVNVELGSFSGELMEQLQNNDFLNLQDEELMEDLLIQCKQLVEMTSVEFRVKCETVVNVLSEKRKQCQQGLLKWMLTRMLFILTRCTRLLHFERGSQQVDEKSLHKLKKCLDSVPRVETTWDHDSKVADLGCDYVLNTVNGNKNELQEYSDERIISFTKDFMVMDQNILSRSTLCDTVPSTEERVDASGTVICRICENVVPSSHLESHSYICAYADKSDLECLDLDGRLSKLAHMLEHIIESFNSRTVASYDSPESSHISNSAVLSEGCSPKISEWRSKGVEGMFEDLHDMDTACIDDSHGITANLTSYLNMKLGHAGPSSSAGSMTSGSSTNTPRSRHFDFFWLEHNNPSEMEDAQQMTEIVNIARCVAGVEISEEGAHEFLLACMEDLQVILQHSKVKALLVDTFGGRIESLLREKLLLSCDLMGGEIKKSTCKHSVNPSFLPDSASQSSASSTPRHPTLKERTSIDDFEIIKPISRGAFGKVFLARKRTTGDLFAIKVLKKLDIIRKNDIERILAERNILITVRNPFVVRFFYSFTSRENLYLVMEYLNGGDLFSLLRKVGCLEENVARIYVAELVLALEYLHSLGIVHRDLKPDNVLIAHDGHIKLTDFGLSKIGLMNSTGDLVGSASDEITLVNSQGQSAQKMDDRFSQSAVGTPDYLAPEILLGTEHGDAADWWSVGIILFELVTGIPPFSAEHPEIIFDNILSRKIPWPSIPVDMSHEAQDLINRFLVHDPDERLGAKGSSEVKAHPFFKGVNWDTLALQKAAFVPNPDSIEDTSYFVSRYTQFSAEMPRESVSSDSVSGSSDFSNAEVEERDECSDLEQSDSNINLAWINFSFKNLSQLASINRDVLLQNWRDPSKDPSKPQSLTDRSNL